MSLEKFKQEISDLEIYLDDYYSQYKTNERFYIKDGIVNIDEYYNSNIKIMWILKEPYDQKDSKGGGWSIVENLKEERSKGLKKDSSSTFHPIIYTTYALLNNINNFNQLDKRKINSEYIKYLNNIAYINIQKFPATARSNDTIILKAYKRDFNAILKQIEIIKPNVIIIGAGSNVYHQLKEDMNKNKTSSNICLINAYHPAQTTINRNKYIDSIIKEYNDFKL